MKTLILASSSPARFQLLKQLCIPFEVMPPDIDESALPGEAPPLLVSRLAREKAEKIAASQTGSIIIACDQIGVFENEILGKPHKREVARNNLERLSGNALVYYTALAVIDSQTGKMLEKTVPTTVHFRTLTAHAIEQYLDNEAALKCAGGLKVEGLGISLLKKIDTEDQSALIGLPLLTLCDFLEALGRPVLEK
jgi:septum formation protein